MKKLKYLLIALVCVTVFSSCSKSHEWDDEKRIGLWDDAIQLSTKTVEFDKHKNSVTISTKGDGWWIVGVSVNEETFGIPRTINIESDNYIFKENCFVVEKKNNNTLSIEIEENTTNVERTMVIQLEAGDYFDYVTITQSAY